MPTNNSVNVGLAGSTGTGSFVGSAAPTFTGVPILAAPSATSLTFSSTSGLIGTTTNNDAAAGSVGEYLSSIVLIGSAVALTSGTAANVATLSLTAGDWDVWGEVYLTGNGSTVVQLTRSTISTTSADATYIPANNRSLVNSQAPGGTLGAGGGYVFALAPCRQSLASTTTVYLIALMNFTISTCSAFGKICARRVR